MIYELKYFIIKEYKKYFINLKSIYKNKYKKDLRIYKDKNIHRLLQRMGNQLQRNFGILGSCFGSLTGVGIVAFNSSISITNIFGNAFVIGSSGLIGSFIGVALGAGISYLLVRY